MTSITQEKAEQTKIRKLRPKLCLYFRTRNSDDLYFDYSVKEVFNVKHETNEKKYFYCRIKSINKIINAKEQKELQPIHNILFLARKCINGYYELIWPIVKFNSLDLYNLNRLDNKMWLLIRTEEDNNDNNNNSTIQPLYENENEDYYLSENDIIKFGERKYEVIKLNIVNNNNDFKTNQISENNKKFKSVFYLPKKKERPKVNVENYNNNKKNDIGYNQETDCRICYGSKSEGENLLINICKCNNIFYHINCLKKFLKRKMKSSENFDKTVTSHKLENFSCEVCQDPYPLRFDIIKNNEQKQECCLVDGLYLPENTNYMILESLTQIIADKEKKKKNTKNIFVIKLTEKEIKVGRSEINDIIDDFPMISREHAVLKFDENEGKVIIKNKGRCGTSVLIKKSVKLEIGQKIYLQVGNTYIKAEVKEDDSKEEEENNSEDNSTYTNKSVNMKFEENSISK